MSLLLSRGDRSIAWFIGLWILAIVLNLAVWGTVIYVAYHFISKWW